ncbi:MAG: large repetitive protein [Acidobacteriota bacterium]|jgi:VCBS repeat-containing protein|nr:large repetitive protein [Acidobacteriota bacterium]
MKFLGSREVRIAFLVLAVVAVLVPELASANTEAVDFYSLPGTPPCRLYDSRQPTPPLPPPPAPAGVLSANASRAITVTGFCGVPTDAVAVSLNLTVAETKASGNLSLYPNGVVVNQPIQPEPPELQLAVASLSFKSGVNRGMILVVELGASGDLIAKNNSSGDLHFIIDVTGYFEVNDPPTITSTDTVSVPENQTAVIDVQSTDPEGAIEGTGLAYGLTGGADQALFSIDPATGVLTFLSAPDFEAPGDAGVDNVYDVQVTVTDSGGLTDVQDLEVTVTDAGEPPTITSTDTVSVPENQTAVIDVQSTDPEGDTEGSGLTYSLAGGADVALFSIVPATGVLTFNSAPDFEAPGDAGANNVYDVQVTVTDSDTLTDVQDIQVTVTAVDEAPSITSPAAVNVPENQTAVIDVQSTDPEGDTEGAGLAYSLTGGADMALFSIVPATGVLTFNSAPDFESPADAGANNVYDVQVTVTDSDTLTGVQNLQVTVTTLNEGPTITSPATVNVPENQTAVIDVQSTDLDGETEGSGLTYSLTGGADVALFSIVPATGVLTFNSAPNFESPADAGSDNVYDVQVTVTDSGTLTDVQNLQATVTNVDEAPSITSLAAVSVPENQTAVIDVQSTDPEGDTEGAGLTYSLTGGADVALFSIVPATGVLTFNSAPNFESPGDAGANNVYDVQVTVTDSDTLTGVQNVQVTVTNLDEPPSITSPAAVNVPENQTAVINVQSTDPEGDTEGAGLTYSLTGGADVALFSIVPATGVLTFNSAPNFESPGDAGANNIYDVQVTVTDSDTMTAVQNLQVTVTNLDEAPSITSLAAVSVPENQAGVIDVQSTDPDGDTEGSGLTYSLTGGADMALFSIVPATGVLTFNSAPNFEIPGDAGANNVYDVQVTVTDSDTLTAVQNLQVTVTNVDEAPSITSLAAVSVPENQTGVIDVQSTDPDGDTEGAGLLYSITGGVDGALFSIVPATGVLTFNSAPNFEIPGDVGANNVYDVQVTVTDSDTLTAAQNIQVTVTNVNEPPVANADGADITEEAPNVAAANTVSGNVLTNDVDPDSALTVSAVAGGTVGAPRAGNFGSVTINSNGSFTYTLDDTNPTVNALAPGGTLVDAFGYTASDGSFTSSSTLTVTIHGADDPATPDNDAHDFLGNTQLEVDRDTAATPEVLATTPINPATLGVLDGDVDPDGGPALTIASIVGCADLTAPFDCVLPGQGTVSLHADGSFSFVPEPGDSDPTASFQYTLVGNPSPGTVTLTRFERVWFVDPNAGGGGNGTSASPYNTLESLDGVGGAGDSDVAGDYIFVHDGSLAMTAAMEMEANQRLIGQGHLAVDTPTDDYALSIPVGLNGNPSPTNLVLIGAHPELTNASGNAVTVGNLMPIEIVGMSLASTAGNAIDLTSTGVLSGSPTLAIANNEIRGAGAEGVDINLNAGTNGTLAVNFTNNTWDLAGTHAGNSFDARTASATANLRVNFSNNTNILSTAGGASGVLMDGSGGGTLTITGFANNTVHQNTAGNGVLITSATFDSDTVTSGFQTVSGGTTLVGTPGDGVGGSSVALNTVSGDLAFTDLDIYASGNNGLQVTGTGAFTGAAGTRVTVGSGVGVIEALNSAVTLSSMTTDLQLSSLRSTNSSSTGVSLTNVSDGGGTNAVFSAGSTSIIVTAAGATGPAFNVSGGNAAITYGGMITNNSASARAVSITTWSGDDASDDLLLSGAIDENGAGILLNGNGGTRAITFSGGMDVDTTTGEGFAATSNTNSLGLHITGTNTIDSISAAALRVTSTTIGSSNLNFRSISSGNNTAATDPANGIVLNATGTSGGLKVAGTGAAGSGGTIQRTTGVGVLLTSTAHVSLASMNVQNSGDDGIRGLTVTNLDLNGCNLSTNGNATAENGLQLGEASGSVVGITGNLSLTNTNITASAGNNVHIRNTSGTLALMNISGGSFNDLNDTTGANSFLFEMSGTAVTTAASINGATFSNNSPQRGLEVQAHETGLISDFMVSGTTFNNNGIHVSFTQDTNSNLTFRMLNNTSMLNAAPLHAINVFSSSTSTGGSITGTIQGNVIGNAAVGSGSSTGNGIRVVVQGRTSATLLIDGNTIRQTPGGRAIDMQFLGHTTTGLGIVSTNDVTLTNNNVQNNGTSFPLAAIFLAADNQGSPARVRADIRGNVVPASGSFDYPTFDGSAAQLIYEELGGATAELIDTAPASANATAQLTSTNTGTSYANGGVALIAGPINTP